MMYSEKEVFGLLQSYTYFLSNIFSIVGIAYLILNDRAEIIVVGSLLLITGFSFKLIVNNS